MSKLKLIALISLFIFFVFSCVDKKGKKEETILKGETTILVDETLLPIVEDQRDVFENQYDAKINLISKSESEIVQMLSQDKGRLAILTRTLTEGESVNFQKLNISPRIVPFAIDGIALITNANSTDSIIDLERVKAFLQGKETKAIQGLVFDNPNSSTVRYIKSWANIKNLPSDAVYSYKTNNEVIQFVSEKEGMIGVVGVNWLSQPLPEMRESLKKVKVLSVNSLKSNKFVKPNQDNIAGGLYPLTRQLKMLNFQGSDGLGIGFASFLNGEIGQRIVLKSGLVPIKFPSRKIHIRREINNEK